MSISFRIKTTPQIEKKLTAIRAHIGQICNNPNHSQYHNYGAKGIRLDDSWTYLGFRNWALFKDYKEGMELYRRDLEGPFSPDNCYWGEPKQRRVKSLYAGTRRVGRPKHPGGRKPASKQLSKPHYLTAFGETKQVVAWLKDPRCVAPKALRSRLWKGWPAEPALSYPPATTKVKSEFSKLNPLYSQKK